MLVLSIVCVQAAEGGTIGDKQLFGTWSATLGAVTVTVVFRENHTISWDVTTAEMPESRDAPGTWRLEENRLLIVWDPAQGPVPAIVEDLTNDTLVLRMPEGPITLHRAKADSHAKSSNQAMERTAGRLGSSFSMKFQLQHAATRSPASRRSSYSR